MRTHRRSFRMLAGVSIASITLLIATETPGQVIQSWATILDDAGRSDLDEFVTLDSAGNVIVGGTSSPDLTVGVDLRLAKLAPSGVVIWSQRFTFGTASESLQLAGLTLDGAGNILAACNEYFGPTNSRVVTLKVSTEGTEIWRAFYDSPSGDVAVGIERDATGRIFVGGKSESPGPISSVINAFIVAYDANGNVLWQDTYDNGRDQELIYDMSFDPIAGAVYLAGGISGQNGGPLLLRYDANGRRRWVKRYAIKTIEVWGWAERVAVGGDGNVVLAGYVSSGSIDIQIIKVDGASGKELWSTVYGEPGFEERVSDLATDRFGNVVVSGDVFGPAGSGNATALLFKYSPNGALSWAINDDRILSTGTLAVDGSGSTYLTGVRQIPKDSFFTDLWLTTRYDALGNVLWTAEYDGNPAGFSNGTSRDLALTSAGDVIVAGDVNGDIHVVSYQQP